jgi:glycosyltransferase involved in cell wall biosynthesis
MSNRAEVSVVIPVRDGDPYIGEALDSIFAQTRAASEIVVVDDGSRDGTAAVVESYGDRVTLLRQDKIGVGAALNSAVAKAGGQLLAFLDADDLWAPSKLELQTEALEQDPDLDVVFAHAEQFFSPELSEDERAKLWLPEPGPALLKGTMMISKERFESVGPFDPTLKMGDFIEWYIRAREAGLAERMLPEVLLSRRVHITNSSRVNKESSSEYARLVGAMLRRRRSGASR